MTSTTSSIRPGAMLMEIQHSQAQVLSPSVSSTHCGLHSHNFKRDGNSTILSALANGDQLLSGRLSTTSIGLTLNGALHSMADQERACFYMHNAG